MCLLQNCADAEFNVCRVEGTGLTAALDKKRRAFRQAAAAAGEEDSLDDLDWMKVFAVSAAVLGGPRTCRFRLVYLQNAISNFSILLACRGAHHPAAPCLQTHSGWRRRHRLSGTACHHQSSRQWHHGGPSRP